MGRKILFAVLGLGATAVIGAAVVASRRIPDGATRAAPDGYRRVFHTEHYDIRATPIVTGLSHPWSLAFLPDGDMLITERAGRLRRVHAGVLEREPIAGTPRVVLACNASSSSACSPAP